MVVNCGLTGVDVEGYADFGMAAKLATTGCWLGKRNSDLASVL